MSHYSKEKDKKIKKYNRYRNELKKEIWSNTSHINRDDRQIDEDHGDRIEFSKVEKIHASRTGNCEKFDDISINLIFKKKFNQVRIAPPLFHCNCHQDKSEESK